MKEGEISPLVSYVVIGLNEGDHLDACFASIRGSELDGVAYEIIYADGGSDDASVEIAQGAGCDQVLVAPKRRSAAENRNAGARAARGQFIQFLDGDMRIFPEWVKHALGVLTGREDVAAVFGDLREVRTSLLYRILELDWIQGAGEVPFCGGAAMFRRTAFWEAGGFPEDVAFGEEPLLCWRIRNCLGKKIVKLLEPMAYHDLAFRGFRDYWRRCVRSGIAFAEVSQRCRGTCDPFWVREVRSNYFWSVAILAAFLVFVVAPVQARIVVLFGGAAVLGRKVLQIVRKGYPWSIALGYAFHTYFAKLAVSYGQVVWYLTRKPRRHNNAESS